MIIERQLKKLLNNSKYIKTDIKSEELIKKENREKILNEPIIKQTLRKLAEE